MLNHVIIFNENHLRCIVKDYVRNYNTDRCHLSVDRDSPKGRAVQKKPSELAKVVALPQLGGLQHRYEWRDPA